MLEWAALGASALAAAGFSARYTWWRKPLKGIPVLMYHHITDELKGTKLPKLRVGLARFARQLDYLQKHGYTAVTLSQALSLSAPAKSVVITFDDGYENFYTNAWPLLHQRGMTATVFIVTGALEKSNLWDREKEEPEESLMSWDQVKELHKQGIEIGGHSHSHLDLTTLNAQELKREITGCQKRLTDILGQPSRVFSYPYGHHNDLVRQTVHEAGFTAACLTEPGKLDKATSPLSLPRIIVKRSDDFLDFFFKLSRGQSRI